jgi:prepilin-type N-terminal cleavage/methylation domain-containing protein
MNPRHRVATGRHRPALQAGFSLMEMMLVMVIFLIVSGAIFGLLNVAQTRYRSEQEFLDTFQNARQGVDLLVREIHSAGYPPAYTYPANQAGWPATYPGGWPTWTDPASPAIPADLSRRFAIPFVGVPVQSCLVNFDCRIPGPFELFLEADLDPFNPNAPEQVEWIHYRVVPGPPGGTATLMRGVVAKNRLTFPGDPTIATVPQLVPFVENVVNNTANPADAVFTYECDPAQMIGFSCNPQAIQTVTITLRVRSEHPDPSAPTALPLAQRYRTITLQASARRVNPVR